MKLLVQPGDGITPIVEAINRAKKSVEILIFRFDRGEVERALANAVSRGVLVQALIAYTNRGGERGLRKLEMRLLAAGVTVARTADDLARYHGKMMIVDRRTLFLLAFNFTSLDIDHSRSFGLITKHPKLVNEAVKLFEADTKRQPYVPGHPSFLVSPLNARKQLAAFIKGAKKELLIWDPEVSDSAIVRLLEERAKAGVDVKIIGRLTKRGSKLPVKKLAARRLHTRTIIRDGRQAFTGSQSLRELELNARREVGMIFRDAKIAARLCKIFEEDWIATAEPQAAEDAAAEVIPVSKVAKKVAKQVIKDMPSVGPLVDVIMKELGEETGMHIDAKEVQESVKDAVKEAVRDAVEEAVAQNGAAR
ncbi:MAG TPA: phospholipase D-like domain-containing protein [Bryobacteraceae bacterium]